MTFIVERILCTHIPFFEDVKDNIIWHIPHQYSNESAHKSEMVGLIMSITHYFGMDNFAGGCK